MQVYASRENPDDGDPVRGLVAFQRARDVVPVGTRKAILELPNRWLALWRNEANARVTKPGVTTIAEGPSSDRLPLTADVIL